MPLSAAGAPAMLAAAVLVTGCGREPGPDAYGTFEATEVVVSAQTTGQILSFTPVEGMQLERGAVVALIDTAQLVLERDQLAAQRAAAGARAAEAGDQLRALQVQHEVAERHYQRIRRLHAERAATASQLDQAERDVRSLAARIDALRAQRRSVGLDVTSAEARVAQVVDRIGKSHVANPAPGTVLATYAREGEVIQAGRPLYRIADLDTLVLRAYVSASQLAAIRIGQAVEVRVDGADGLVALPGTVTWVAATAEFTPTPIQTREERGDLVYAVKIRVPNPDGALKIGMPGDVTFAQGSGKRAPS